MLARQLRTSVAFKLSLLKLILGRTACLGVNSSLNVTVWVLAYRLQNSGIVNILPEMYARNIQVVDHDDKQPRPQSCTLRNPAETVPHSEKQLWPSLTHCLREDRSNSNRRGIGLNKDGNRWPSRIRVDKGVENVLVCDAMIEARGEGLLNIDDPLRLFTLHLIFLPRINKSLGELLEGFNHHKVRTEKNWSPYQMWLKGMLHGDNPLSHGLLDEEPSDVNFYGYDAQGPTCLGDDNNVVVKPIEFEFTELLES
ncbi:hypothetical protein AWC38_SpisGene629 [Stylophora pistillata]|uniref:Integrase core domain-containing protein n=1 Tax=Stylophora pistillata TaxID=50429 RepID=A0A2B4SZ75_STYPI|nr:hypothetical protein AWC38_SpisGene629 [Stylophora pistillata]